MEPMDITHDNNWLKISAAKVDCTLFVDIDSIQWQWQTRTDTGSARPNHFAIGMIKNAQRRSAKEGDWIRISFGKR